MQKVKLLKLFKEAEEKQQKSGKFIMVDRSYEYSAEFKNLLTKIKEKMFKQALNEAADDEEEAARRAAEQDMAGEEKSGDEKEKEGSKKEPKKSQNLKPEPKTNSPKPPAEKGEQKPGQPNEPNEQPAQSTEEVKRENPTITDPEKNIFSDDWKLMRLPHTTNKTTKSQFDIRYRVESNGSVKSYIVFYSLEGLEKSGKENWDWKEEELKAKFVGACPMPDAASYEALEKQFVQFRWLFGKALDFIDKHEGQMRPQ